MVQTLKKKKEASVTKMSLCLVGVFTACAIPYLINRIQRGGFQTAPIGPMVYLSTLCISLNSAANWIIYCAFTKRFRHHFKRICSYLMPSRACAVWKPVVPADFHSFTLSTQHPQTQTFRLLVIPHSNSNSVTTILSSKENSSTEF
jgi:hypothetical protein